MKFFRELDAILGHSNGDKTNRSDDNGEKPGEWTETKIENNYRGKNFDRYHFDFQRIIAQIYVCE